ncbi:formyl transferase [Marinobacter sp.]|uniref:formyl transferase n=1 Tax=Marinobacter sp. TaxID=50741 RepID=UPI0034A328FB
MVIVSQDKSDLFFANRLAKVINVVGVVVENQLPERDSSSLLRKSLKYASRPATFAKKCAEVLDRRFNEPKQLYNRPENALDFGEEGRAQAIGKEDVESRGERVPVWHTRGVNDINSPENREWICNLQPDVIAVCGASILKADLLSVPRHGVLNLHGGLSQFYRGLFTTDWAIHNAEPECVGATVHFVASGVDDGDVIYQGRPVIQGDDHPNSLYAKVVRLGVEMMTQAIIDIEHGCCRSVRLSRKGPLYLNHMFDVRAKRRTWQQVRKGVIPDYLSHKVERDARVITELINDFALAKPEISKR